MNPDSLARWLRTGGYDVHQRRLREYLGTHGLPCTRRVGQVEVVFHLEAGQLVAQVDGDTVADEHRCYLPLPELRARRLLERDVDPGALTVRLGEGKARLDRAARERGISSSALARTAILSYLDARGQP